MQLFVKKSRNYAKSYFVLFQNFANNINLLETNYQSIFTKYFILILESVF